MNQHYPVHLTAEERRHLQPLIASGTAPARMLMHARIRRKADRSPDGPGWTDQVIADAVDVSQSTIARVRKQAVCAGVEAALNRRAPRRVYQRKLDGAQEAHLVALACSAPRQARRAGPCACLPTRWSSWRWWRPSPTRRCAARSKKRAKAVAEAPVEHSPAGQCRLCLAHGGCAGGLHPPL